MTSTNLLEAAAGLVLVFFLPGYATTRAIFPEWRLRGREAWRRGVEVVTLSFVLSVAWTLVLGYLLLAGFPGGFQASWGDPQLELGLLLVTVVAFLAGWRLGAYGASAPSPPQLPPEPGGEGAWELGRHLDLLARDERRLRHELRVEGENGPRTASLKGQLLAVQEEGARLRREREAEYAR
jgi:hypothetical protein